MNRRNITNKLEKERKKKTLKRFIKKTILFFSIVGILILFASQTYSLTRPLIKEEFTRFTKEFLMIRELAVIGASDFADKEIRSFIKPIIDVNPNIFTFPMENIKLFLATRPYISKAHVRKELPGRIVVDIKEKKPIAIFFDGDLKLLDENGEVIRPMSIGENIDVPIITLEKINEDSMANYLKSGCNFISLDNQSTPYLLPSEVRLTPSYIEIKSLELKTSSNYIPSVYIGYDELEKKILNLKKLWTDIVNKKENIEYVDARFSKGISINQKNIVEVKDGKRQ